MAQPSSTHWRLIAAFAAVYLIWGSTYLAIRVAVQTLPPFLMAGTRFLIAGLILYTWAKSRQPETPTRIQWRSTLIIGALLLVGGNGGVAWAVQFVPSGVASLVVAAVPLWIVLIDWLRPGGQRPAGMVLGGVLVGLFGIALLINPGHSLQNAQINPVGIAALLIGSLCWASGSLYARSAPLPQNGLLTNGMEMLCGGALMLVIGTVAGEWARVNWATVTLQSVGAWVYLIFIGAIIGFSAYMYLIKHTTATRAATYAYVNPVVAVFLGWALAGEAVTPEMIAAAGIIIGSVFIINTYRGKRPVVPAPVPPVKPVTT